MKRLLVILALFSLVLMFSIPAVHAEGEITTTQEEVITTEAPLVEDSEGIFAAIQAFIEGLTYERVMSLIQLFSFAAAVIIALKQRIEVAVSKARLNDAQDEVSDLQVILDVVTELLLSQGVTLQAIVQASKMESTDKAVLAENWTGAQKKVIELRAMVLDKYKKPIAKAQAVVSNAMDVAQDVISGASSVIKQGKSVLEQLAATKKV